MKKKFFKSTAYRLYLIFPKKLFNFFAFLYGFLFFKISYSQHGEDLILAKYLKYKNIKKGKYLDIGAFHPRWISNTHLLHKNGFNGYCVDLDEEKLKWIRFDRGNKVKTVCGAVSIQKKKYINFYKFKRKSPFSEVDTTDIKFAKKFKRKRNNEYEIKKVKNYHINEIYSKVGKINVLNIDIEGVDFEILKSSSLKIIDPEIIIYEDHNEYFPSNKTINFFKKKNYRLLSICGLSKCFAKK